MLSDNAKRNHSVQSRPSFTSSTSATPTAPTAPIASVARSKRSKRKMKTMKNVSFSHTSKLHMYESEALTPATKRQLYVTKADRIQIKNDTALTIREIRKTLQTLQSLHQESREGVEGVDGVDFPTRPMLQALQKANPVQAEDVIGIEQYLRGTDPTGPTNHVRALTQQRMAISRSIVAAYRHLHELRQAQWNEVQCQNPTSAPIAPIAPKGIKGKGIKGILTNEYVDEKIASLYKRLTRKSAFQALDRADYVRALNHASVPSEQSQRLRMAGMARTKPCHRAAHAA